LHGWLAEELGSLTEITADPRTQEAFRRHRVRLVRGDLTDPAALTAVRKQAEDGLSVLVCCNTVARAQAVFQAVRQMGMQPELLHSRFHAADRSRKERLLQQRMGTRSVGSDRHVVMVATQVVEVSLDIDFDTLFTDLAPLDALLQRFGRVNRARKVALRDIFVHDGPIVAHRPYDEGLLRAALAILQREFGEAGAVLEEGRVSDWLDEVYSGELAVRWERDYRSAKELFESAVLGHLFPFQSCPELEDRFYQAFDSVEVLPASLRDEYAARVETQPLSASELLVPVRWGQLAQLARENAIVERLEPDGIPVVDRPYSYDLGLQIVTGQADREGTMG
jgi:CRISPR-associated endonuclease/helicase Cas3